ncbi:YkgJ family cysteine cluster protein [Candidatus Woesearchaeota archaeon]|nr:YkgJ family cysteine cluster protein [Candidatus Woesearchaeota archaeon]MBW3022068.1 YkgJ family cysteine cluster protein [Candidatus Woesearchaeota archaeon]
MITKNTPLSEVLKLAKDCKRCGRCCTYGSGFLVGGDVQKIAAFLQITEKELIENYLEEAEMFNTKMLRPKFDKPYGTCIFLKDDDCTIHQVKPLHCRVGSPCSGYGEELSEWFKLNFCVNPSDAESIRQWALYLENNKTIPGGELLDLVDGERLKKILRFEEL